jgi:hypothetical protein
MKDLLLILTVLILPVRARATTTSCANATDGTPCVDACIAVGTCTAHVCVPTSLRPAGTPCSTDNPCTISDQCQAGVCVAGSPVICPDQSACLVGVCNPRIGCTVKDACPPDLAGPSDLGEPDLGGIDLAPSPSDLAGDMCTVPTGSELFSCDNPPDGFFASDGGDASVETLHVRGSRVGDCSLGSGELSAPLGLSLLLLLVAAALRRRA